MPKVSLTRGKIRSALTYILIVSASFAFVSLSFDSEMNYSPNFYTVFTQRKLSFEYNASHAAFRRDLTDLVRSSFNNYVSHCGTSDEINPLTNECVNTSGIMATLLESLETLYLLGIKDSYNRAHLQVRTQFKCNKLGLVNKRELWTRGVGSLIGAYSLTGDKMYINKATECANQILKFEKKAHIYIDMRSGQVKRRPMENTSELSDLSAGLPELYALYNYTRDESYLLALKRYLQKIPTSIENFHTYYDSVTLENLTSDYSLDFRTVPYYYDMALLGLMHGTRQYKGFLQNIEEYVQLYEDQQLYPLLDVEMIRNTTINGSAELYNIGYKEYSPPYTAFVPGFPDEMIPFSFDGNFLRLMYKKANTSLIIGVVGASLDGLRVRNGISSLGKSSKQRAHFTNVQPSSFFGEWAKFGALSVITKPNMVNAIFNSRGHILYTPK